MENLEITFNNIQKITLLKLINKKNHLPLKKLKSLGEKIILFNKLLYVIIYYK